MTIDDFEEYAKAHEYVIFTRQQYEHVIDVFNNYELLTLDYYGRQEPRWIPVSERLPEDRNPKLVYLTSKRVSIMQYNEHRLPFSNEPIGWGYFPDEVTIDLATERVIAWMPLPKPYDPQESEDEK